MNSQAASFGKPPPENGERHTLAAESEIRLEIPSNVSVTLTLLAGSAEIFGAEMALATDLSTHDARAPSTAMVSKQSYSITGNTKLAIFTWHGCTLDVDVEYGKAVDISYTSSETQANIAFVNTHAQLEVLRDQALQTLLQRQPMQNKPPLPDMDMSRDSVDGPRVLLCGPPDSGKTTLARILIAYGKPYLSSWSRSA
jgi:polyribonucleotide 5'-hydroxyl-kinase